MQGLVYRNVALRKEHAMKRYAWLVGVTALLALSWVWLTLAGADQPLLSDLVEPLHRVDGSYFARTQKLAEWTLLRTVTANDTALTPATNVWTKLLEIPPGWSTISVAALAYGDGDGAGDPNGGSFALKLYLGRRYGPGQVAATATWAVGELQAAHAPTALGAYAAGAALTVTDEDYKFGELPVVTTYWRSDVVASGTSDDMGNINLDPMEEWGLFPEVTELSGITTLYLLISGR